MRRTNEPPNSSQASGRLTLSGEGLAWLGAAVLLGAVGWLKSINLVLILAYMMLVLVLLNGLIARRHVRRVRAGRVADPPIHAGEEATIRLSAVNDGRRPATIVVESASIDPPVVWFLHRLAAGAEATHAASRIVHRRGRYRAALRVRSGIPFGLVQYESAEVDGDDLVVLPALGVADPGGMRHWLLRQPGGDGRARKVLRRATTDQADVRGVRPYRAGDPIRGIHWRSSARRGELMVREYDAAPSSDLVLVVEPWLPASPTPHNQENLEAALCLAATVARTWSRTFGTRIAIAIAGDPASVRTAGSTDSSLRTALAPLAEVIGGKQFTPLTTAALDRSLLRAARVVVSSRSSSPYSAALTATTGRSFVAVSPLDKPSWYTPPKRAVAAD